MPSKNDQNTRQNRLLYLGNKLSSKGRTPTSIETLGRFLENEGFKIITASSKENQLLRLFDMIYVIFKNRNKIDIIIIDSYSTLAFWYAYICGIIAKFFGIDYITILRGGDLPKRLHLNPKICQQLFGEAKVNISPSMYLLYEFNKAGFSNIKYIPNTIEIEKYPFRLRTQLKPRMLWVRSIADIYNPMMALFVLKRLKQIYSNISLSMVGPFKDDSINACRAFANKHQLSVTFTGQLSKMEWITYARDFDIFLNTTYIDNTPVSVIEAMALGLPVVSTSVGGIPFLLDDELDALLVQSDNVDQMTEAILYLLDHPEFAKHLVKTARRKAENFDWLTVKHEWFGVLGE